MPTPQLRNDFGIWHYKAKDIFSTDWLNYVKSIGLQINGAMLFYREACASTLEAHIDIATAEPLELCNFGINWCVGGKGSEMVWFERPYYDKNSIAKTAADTPYIAWPIDSLKEIERRHIGLEPVLVRTDIPHCIIMKSDPRWCISVRLDYKSSMTWEQIVKYMGDRNILL